MIRRLFRRNIVVMTFLAVTLVAAPAMPLMAYATTSAPTMPSIWPTGYWAPNGIVSCTAFYSSNIPSSAPSQYGRSYCTSLNDLVQTLLNALSLGISIALFIVAPLSIVVGGIMLMLAGPNPEMIGKSKRILLGTVVGIAIILCSYLILSTVFSIFHITQYFGGFGSSA